MARYREMSNPRAKNIRMELCTATRRDGALCCKTAKTGTGLCSWHNGSKKTDKAKVIYHKEIYPKIIARAPDSVRITPEYKKVASIGAKKYMAQVCLAYEKFTLSQDMKSLRNELEDINSRFDAMMERERKTMERRYREREEQGIPHPASRAKW